MRDRPTARRLRPAFRPSALLLITVLFGVAGLWGCGEDISGVYDEVNGTGKLEFRGGNVYVTTLMGMTFVTTYSVDGDRVIIKGAGGTQVYTRRGDTLDGGAGATFTKK